MTGQCFPGTPGRQAQGRGGRALKASWMEKSSCRLACLAPPAVMPSISCGGQRGHGGRKGGATEAGCGPGDAAGRSAARGCHIGCFNLQTAIPANTADPEPTSSTLARMEGRRLST